MTHSGEPESFEISYPTTEEASSGGSSKGLPEGLYLFQPDRIRHTKHARGPLFGLMLKVLTCWDEKLIGRSMWTNIIFLPYFALDTNGKMFNDKDGKPTVTKGAGIARSFLRAVGQEYKGEKVMVKPGTWKVPFGARVKMKNGQPNVINFMTEDEYHVQAKKASSVEALPEEAIF